MSRVMAIVSACMCVVASSMAGAATGLVKGTVEFVRVHDVAISGQGWAPPTFWFSLNGVGAQGACGTWAQGAGRVLFVGRTREAYLAVLSASMAGKEIAVFWDDTQQVNGLCIAGWITQGNPPPLF